jgi:hypothetical protein
MSCLRFLGIHEPPGYYQQIVEEIRDELICHSPFKTQPEKASGGNSFPPLLSPLSSPSHLPFISLLSELEA